eukprot:14350131-Ditylum_brightwellii.AAC.1
MANDDNLQVGGDAKLKKSEKNISDSHFSITTIHSGTAANASGPFLFLGSGKTMNNRSLSARNLVKRHGAKI